MTVFLFLVLVSAGVFLDTTEAQEDLSKLSDNYRKGVELAVKQINSHQTIKSTFLFFKTVEKSDIDVSIFFFFKHSLLFVAFKSHLPLVLLLKKVVF